MIILYSTISLLLVSMGLILYHMANAPIMDDDGNIVDEDGNILNEKGQIIVKKEDRNMNQ
jgi:hypothetical protein